MRRGSFETVRFERAALAARSTFRRAAALCLLLVFLVRVRSTARARPRTVTPARRRARRAAGAYWFPHMDALKLLKQDHRDVEALFKRYEHAGDGAAKLKKQISERVIESLSKHAAIEEELFYPAARELSEDLEDLVLEALEEHHVAKATLAELEKMKADDDRFDAKMTVLIENIRHHVKEEEGELFPELQQLMSTAQREALGAAMKQAKSSAPTRPHPMAPDTPPGNFISSPLAAVLDLGKDMVRGAVHSAKRAMRNGRAAAARARRSPRRSTRGRRS